MRILAIIVTYYPEEELLRRCVSSFIDHVDHVMVWENTPSPDAATYRFLPEGGKIEYAGEGFNVGISQALNHAWKRASADGCDFLLTMDQDSWWRGFDKFVSHIGSEGCPDGLFGPTYRGEVPTTTFQETEVLITSGMLVPVRVLDALGGYCEAFRIDAIDTELVCRAMDAGYGAYHVSDCRLVHRLGDKQSKTFLGRNYTTPGYSPDRLYGICRNHGMVFRKYPQFKSLRKRFLKIWLWQNPIRILLGEKRKLHKLLAILRGFLDGCLSDNRTIPGAPA